MLAQSIHTCLADHYEAPVFVVRSCIGRSDSVIEGRSYRLRVGPATTRNAIALLRLEGASPGLIERAEETARDLDRRERPAMKPR